MDLPGKRSDIMNWWFWVPFSLQGYCMLWFSWSVELQIHKQSCLCSDYNIRDISVGIVSYRLVARIWNIRRKFQEGCVEYAASYLHLFFAVRFTCLLISFMHGCVDIDLNRASVFWLDDESLNRITVLKGHVVFRRPATVLVFYVTPLQLTVCFHLLHLQK
jgi:hypothetical protein